MQDHRSLTEVQLITVRMDDEVLSPESYVFVALMSVEEGPNKASFLAIQAPQGAQLEPQG